MSSDNTQSNNISINDLKNEIQSIKSDILSTDDSPQFPVKIFGAAIEDIIQSTHKSLGFPIDYTGASILYCCSIAIGATYQAQLKNGWIESATLYLAILGKSGISKSHPLSWALNPIFKRDNHTFKIYEQKMKYYEDAVSMSKKEREEAGLDQPQEKPHWIKSLMTDFTPEALIDVHYHNKRGIGIYVDELASWFKSFGRYTKSAEQEFWLSTWGNKPITVDRKGSEPCRIGFPFISVAGTIQYSLLPDLSSDNRGSNGFLDRILFVLNESLQKPYWTEDELPDDIPMIWGSVLDNLFSIAYDIDEFGQYKSKILKFNAQAKRLMFQWNRRMTDECNDLDNEALSGIYSKMDTYCIRFALILEVVKNAVNGTVPKAIGVDAVQGAFELADYFIHTAKKVRSILDTSIDPVEKLPDDKRKLYDRLPINFEASEAVKIGSELSIPERNIYRLLKDTDLFKKVKRGFYEKLI